MAGPYITLEAMVQQIADTLGTDLTALDERWSRIAEIARQQAYQDLLATLAGQGYLPAQIDQWDMRELWNGLQGRFRAMQQGAQLTGMALETIKELDCRETMKTLPITVNGLQSNPANTVTEGGLFPVTGGQMDTTNYRFTMEDEF